MKQSLLLLVTCLLVMLFGPAHADKTVAEYEQELREHIENSEEPYKKATIAIKTFHMEGDTTNTIANIKRVSAENTIREIRQQISALADNAPFEQFEDKELARKVQLLRHKGRHVLPHFNYSDFTISLDKLKELPQQNFHAPCEEDEETICSYTYVPEVLTRYKGYQSPTEMNMFWGNWRNDITDDARKHLENYVKWIQHKAVENGFDSPVAYYYRKYEDDTMLDDFAEVMRQLHPLYKQVHAYVRHILEKELDVKFENGLIPHTYLEQLVEKAWLNDSVLTPPHSEDYTVPDIDEALVDQYYTNTKFVKFADKFYLSLGFDELPESFWETDLDEKSDSGNECTEDIYEYRGGAAVIYCTDTVTYRKLIQMHRVMGKVRYAFQRSNLSWVFDREPSPGFSNALGESSVLVATTYKYLNRTDITPDAEYDPHLALNRLYRMLAKTFFTAPEYFIFEVLTADLLSGKVTMDQLNCRYWALMEEYLGVVPPMERTNKTIDLSYRFYYGLDSYKQTHTSKLFAEILGYQLYKAFCVNSVSPDNPEDSLDNCEYFGNEQVGNWLREIMSAGASKSWRDIIEPIVGRRTLDGEAIIEYYAPAIREIEKFNANNNVEVGWSSQEACKQVEADETVAEETKPEANEDKE